MVNQVRQKSSTKRARAQRLDPAERRPQLLQCAIRVFARRGLGGAHHAEIAREARVSVPTVFFYFLDWSTATREEIWPHYLEFQERIVAIIANTVRRWRLDRGITDDEAEDDARLIVGSAHMIAQLKFTRCPADKVDHFLRTLVRSTLGAAP